MTLLNYSIVVILLVLSFETNAAVNKEVFFGCEKGFQYETKKDAARCIKQKKLSFRPPLACSLKGRAKKLYRLMVDYRELKDLCVVVASETKTPLVKRRSGVVVDTSASFVPRCQTGYQLKSRRGRDACTKGDPELIKPPSKRVSR